MKRHARILATGCLLIWSVIPQLSVAETCRLKIDSYLGQTLDARWVLDAAGDKLAEMRFRHASSAHYKERNLPYTDLHRRILVEPVLSAVPAYVAISSIGVLNQKMSTVLLEIDTAEAVRFEPCHIRLTRAPIIEPEVSPKRTLTAPEILSKLLVLLSADQGLTHAEVMAELRSLQTDDFMRSGERRLIVALRENSVDKEFTEGLRALMTFEEEQLFSQKLERGATAAVTNILFSVSGKPLLNRLLQEGLTERLTDDGAVSAEMLQRQLSVLENQLAYAQSETVRSEEIPIVSRPHEQSTWKAKFYQWVALPYFWWGLAMVSGVGFLMVIGRYIVHNRRHESE